MKDEILNKVYSTDETPIPRYQIVDRDGNVVLSGVEIRLLNLISQIGTPYNTASVLPNSVANKICPEIPNPNPADAFAGLLPLRGGTMTGVISMGGYKITGLGAPTADTDASTKEYVDDRTLVATDPNNDGNIVLRYGSSVVGGGGGDSSPGSGGLTAEQVQAMIDAALGGIENGTY